MKASTLFTLALAAVTFTAAGCAGYQRGSSVPKDMRSINIAAFENRTEYPKAGAITTQQVIDAIIEDGTFTPTDYQDARLRVQGKVMGVTTDPVSYDRNSVIVPDEYRIAIRLQLYVHDTQTGETLINGKTYSAGETMLTRQDYQTGLTDALPRVARKLSQRVVDELNSLGVTPPKAVLEPAEVEDAPARDEECAPTEETAESAEVEMLPDEELADAPAVEVAEAVEAEAEPADEALAELPAE